MLKYIKIIAILFIMQSKQSAFGQEVLIKGHISGSSDPDIKINFPVEGKYFAGANLLSKWDSTTKEFEARILLDKAGFVTLMNNWRAVKIFARPGSTYQINWNFSKPYNVQVSGPESEGHMLLQKLNLGGNGKQESKQLDSLPNVKERLLLAKKNAKLKIQRIESLYKEGKIKDDFYKSTRNLVESDRINSLSTNFFFEYRKWEKRTANDTENLKRFFKDYLPEWGKLYNKVNKSQEWLSSSVYPDILERYYSYLNIRDSSRLIFGRGNYAINYIERFKKTLSGKTLAYAWANMIVVGINQNKYEREWLANFKEFRSMFPESKLLPYLEPIVQQVAVYNDQQAANSNGKIRFVANYDQLHSFKDLLSTLKGQITYIDLWATWCQPCREELQYSIALHPQLQALGIETLYISLDKENAHELWKSMVYGLGLQGLNMRVSPSLHSDLQKEIPKFYGIPRYLIVDKSGKVVEWDAKRPSDKLILIDQLKKYLRPL